MPTVDCKHVYILESGSMIYLAHVQEGPKLLEKQMLCLACLWTEWHHRGRLTSGQNMSYFVKVHCEAFGQLVVKFGGSLWRYLQIFGILLVSELEHQQETGRPVTDLTMDEVGVDGGV